MLKLAPNVAALVSIFGAVATAVIIVTGWFYGAGAHAERDAQLRQRIEKLEAVAARPPRSDRDTLAEQCVRLSQQLATTDNMLLQQQAREAMSELGCTRGL